MRSTLLKNSPDTNKHAGLLTKFSMKKLQRHAYEVHVSYVNS